MVSRKEGSLSVTDRVSAPDGTDLTNWEELPEEIPGKIPVMYYRNGAIVYEYEEAPETTEDGTETPPVPMDYGETVNGLIRRKYTLSEELAILRQRDTKSEEFEAYNAYAESCKEEARLLIEKQKH